MNKIFATSLLIFFLSFSNSYSESEIFQGSKTTEFSADPSVIGVYIGPSFPKSEFEKLNLPERFYEAHYRLIYNYGEIYYCITAELIGLFEESDPEIINSYQIPLLGNSDNCIKGGIDFGSWIDHRTFETGKMWKKRIRIYRNGKFSIAN